MQMYKVDQIEKREKSTLLYKLCPINILTDYTLSYKILEECYHNQLLSRLKYI